MKTLPSVTPSSSQHHGLSTLNQSTNTAPPQLFRHPNPPRMRTLHPKPRKKKRPPAIPSDVRGVNCWKLGRPIRLGHQIDYWLMSSARLTNVGGRSILPNCSISCAKEQKSKTSPPHPHDPAGWRDFSPIHWLFAFCLLVFRRRDPTLPVRRPAPKPFFRVDFRRRTPTQPTGFTAPKP